LGFYEYLIICNVRNINLVHIALDPRYLSPVLCRQCGLWLAERPNVTRKLQEHETGPIYVAFGHIVNFSTLTNKNEHLNTLSHSTGEDFWTSA